MSIKKYIIKACLLTLIICFVFFIILYNNIKEISFEFLLQISIFALLLLSFNIYLSYKIANEIKKQLLKINLKEPLKGKFYEELYPFLFRIEKNNLAAKEKIEELKYKNQEKNYVTEKISDGILAIDKSGMIISANKRAQELLKCSVGGFYLENFRDILYEELIQRAFRGISSISSLKINKNIYQFSANSVELKNNQLVVFLFIRDITQEINSLEIRRNFSANVSHELKTPITSIMGSAEIIAQGIAKTGDIKHFAQKIYDESTQLLKIIDDIMKISKLEKENENEKLVFDYFNIIKICEKVKFDLISKAEAKNISFRIICESKKDIQFYCNQDIIYEIIYNLCENAIIYNKINGSIELKIKEYVDKIIVCVIDSGIGIVDGETQRIFERFYKVDESHSRGVSGTGVGLSMVKYGTAIHKAKLNIQSKIGVGTQFEIEFPKNKKK